MAAINSTMLPLGTPAPDFDLPDPDGERYQLADFADADGLAVAFICNHCPFVKHVQKEFVAFARDYAPRKLAVVAINSNDAKAHPDDAPVRMREVAQRLGYVFPYLYDDSQEVAKAYRAACTPDFFLFDKNRRLVYRGQFDGSRPGNGVPVTGVDLRAATDALLAGGQPDTVQLPSIGCNIKWKPGNAPAYF
jgi:peroxiredoxin